MVANTGLEELCHVVESAEEMVKLIDELKDKPFTAEEIQMREKLLMKRFSNAQNAHRLIEVVKGY
jgi:predicted Zn-dependent peptidase